MEALQFSVFYRITFTIYLKRWGLLKFFYEDVRSVKGIGKRPPLVGCTQCTVHSAHCAEGFEHETATQHSIELQNVQRRTLLTNLRKKE